MAKKKVTPEAVETPVVTEPVETEVVSAVAEETKEVEEAPADVQTEETPTKEAPTDEAAVEEPFDPEDEEAEEDALYSGEDEVSLSDDMVEALMQNAQNRPDDGAIEEAKTEEEVEEQSEQSTKRTRQPVQPRDERLSLREAVRNTTGTTNQDTRFAEYDVDDIRLQTDVDRIRRETNLLHESRAKGLVLEGKLIGTEFLGDEYDRSISRNHEELASRVVAIVKFGGTDVTIPYKEFVGPETRRPLSASINSYSTIINRAINTMSCTKVSFIVTDIIKDKYSNKPLYIGSRNEGNKRLALRSYLGIQYKRNRRVVPEIVDGMSYPARIVNKVTNGIRCELRGISFFLRNADICYSRRQKNIQQKRDNPSRHLWVYVTNIRMNPETGLPTATFSGKNPKVTPTESYIREKGLYDASGTQNENNLDMSGTVKSLEAQVVAFSNFGVYCELTGYEGVFVSCRFSDDPRFRFLEMGNLVNVRVSKSYIIRNGEAVILGGITRIANHNPTADFIR